MLRQGEETMFVYSQSSVRGATCLGILTAHHNCNCLALSLATVVYAASKQHNTFLSQGINLWD